MHLSLFEGEIDDKRWPRARKERLTQKFFIRADETKCLLNFYGDVLPLLKSYVLIFQSRQPLIYRTHDEEERLLRQLLACFVKQECLQTSAEGLTKLNLHDDDMILPSKLIFIGNAKKQIQSIDSKKMMKLIKCSYIKCCEYLQKILPLKNQLLRAASALDPQLSEHHIQLLLLKQLKTRLLR